MTAFFLRRPVLAGVASVIILILGLIAIPSLPVAQYPKVAPPQVTVTTAYIGANAGAVESAVTTPLEEAINGVEGLRYMTSVSSNDGTSTITVTFNLGRDIDAARSDVQAAVFSAAGRLPQTVQLTGISVKKSSSAIILGVGIQSDGRLSTNELSDFAEHHVIDAIKRVPGVSDAIVFGLRRYAMRLWIDPQRLAAQGLTAGDVIAALQSQNQQVAAGAVGAQPTTGNQLYQVQLNASGRLSTPEQFDRLVIKRTANGGYVRLRDIGRAELGAEDYTSAAHWNGKDCVGFAVIQAQNANALDVASQVRTTLDDLAKTFPPGVSYVIPFDATLFVRESIKEVGITLLFAILLVVLVIYIFIQDWKMTLVPMITIPVSLIGTFAFAITIACSILISLFTALTLAPPLSALLLNERPGRLPKPFRVFNRGIMSLRGAYHRLVPQLVGHRFIVLGAFAACFALTAVTYVGTPTAFIPDEDQGYLIVLLQAPVGTSSDYERRVADRVGKKILAAVPEAEGVFAIDGFGFTGNAPNRGAAFIPLKPWAERSGPQHTFGAILARLYPILAQEPEAQVFAFNPPSVQGIGNFGGFQFQVLDENDIGFQRSTAAVYGLLHAVNTDPHFAGAFTSFRNDQPQFDLAIDRDKSESLGIPFAGVAQTLAVFEGSQYVNDFDLHNRSYRVYVQADAKYRSNLEGLNRMYVRSADGGLVPLSGLMTPTTAKVPTEITHFNLFRSFEIDGAPRPGVGSGDVIDAMQKLSDKTLPTGMRYAWFGLSRDQIEGGNTAALVFGLGLIFVFLVLAAQYENFWDPFVILLSVPLALLGALLAIKLRGFPSDVFVQVGFVMLIGLASKNAILIVEFANQLRETGLDAATAVSRAAETRLRPILMTSLAFIFGILPLTWASGAGSASRNSLGTAVFGGMILSSVLNLVFVPVIYVLIEGLRDRFAPRHHAKKPEEMLPTLKEPATV